MKKLYLVRHAKSSWNFEQLDDFHRPVGKRGRRDLRRMGEFIGSEVDRPDLMISSTASRAFYTALFFADYWKYPEEDMIISDVLYHAGVNQFEAFIREIEHFDTVAVFAHNPGLTMLHNHLCDEILDNIPTCAIAGLSFEIASWRDFGKQKGKQLFYYAPKEI